MNDISTNAWMLAAVCAAGAMVLLVMNEPGSLLGPLFLLLTMLAVPVLAVVALRAHRHASPRPHPVETADF